MSQGIVESVTDDATGERRVELSAAEIAQRHGLAPAGVRPSLGAYLGQLWDRRHFLLAFASAQVTSRYARASLGALWQVLTPLLQAAVYLLLFGVLLNVHRQVPNFVGFLVVGVFTFSFTQRCVQQGARSITNNLGLIRALHFPRATLPLASTLAEVRQLGAAVAVLAGIVLVTGEPLRASWLLVPVVFALQGVFNVGLTLAVARVAAHVRDIQQVLPFVTRTWLYLSGIFYSVPMAADRLPDALEPVLYANPAAVYIDLVRRSMLASHTAEYQVPHAWPLAVAWAFVALVLGFLYFWRAEDRYGRG